MRIVTILLAIAVIFFCGMFYGSYERGQQQVESTPLEQEIERVSTEETFEQRKSEPPPKEEKDYTVHKTASFLEKIVTSLYEYIVQFMYRIASLFFD